jgi:NAD(P)-dependent dehydrogenase (short-subunit alcohol dehydrogenase family)
VFAGVHRQEDGQALRRAASERLLPVRIDVTDGAWVTAARDLVAPGSARRRAWPGWPTTPAPRWRTPRRSTLTGHLAVIQAFLPLLRRGRGRIVNVSSVGQPSDRP